MWRRNVGGFKTCFKVKNFESKTKKGKAKDISRMIPRLLAYALLRCKETGNIGCANLEGRVQDRQGRSIVLCMYVCVYACIFILYTFTECLLFARHFTERIQRCGSILLQSPQFWQWWLWDARGNHK